MSNKLVYMLPLPSHARQDEVQSINQIVLYLNDHLPEYGYQLTEIKSQADLIAGHAGTPDNETIVDVAHLSGLYPTATAADSSWQWSINARVIETCRHAAAVTVPSAWVGEILQRDMGFSPDVISWGIDTTHWQPSKEHGGYVLWNKTRSDSVCDPAPLVKLAAICPQQLFLTTFLSKDEPNEKAQSHVTPNIKAIGRVPHEEMRQHIRNAACYLATTRETFGLSTIESMASGVPILGYDWAGTADIVTHGVDGYLVQPHDIEGLKKGLEYCIKHRAVLGANARKKAMSFQWDDTARKIAAVYDRVLSVEPRPHLIDSSLYMV
jgi:glycosyltransferase involved in cell wall biosynthesis